MKKIITLVISIALILTSVNATAYSMDIPGKSIRVTINGSNVQFDSTSGIPFIDKNYRTQVPFRTTLETFGAQVLWDSVNQTAIAIKEDVIVKIPIGQSYIDVNGEKVQIDTRATIVGGRTYLPIRSVLEAFDADVNWNAQTSTISIKEDVTKPVPVINYSYGTLDTEEYSYTGYLNNNIPDIQGLFKYRDGGYYSGGVLNGKFNGLGQRFYGNGDQFIGNYFEGLKDGSGIYNATGIAKIFGTWTGNVLNGATTITYDDGSKYIGSVSGGKRNGFGTYYYSNGDVYTGEWLDDRFDGTGRYKFKNGFYYDGTWINGLLNGDVIYKMSFITYKCTFEDGVATSVKIN